jgi:hypothetical protein
LRVRQLKYHPGLKARNVVLLVLLVSPRTDADRRIVGILRRRIPHRRAEGPFNETPRREAGREEAVTRVGGR